MVIFNVNTVTGKHQSSAPTVVCNFRYAVSLHPQCKIVPTDHIGFPLISGIINMAGNAPNYHASTSGSLIKNSTTFKI